MKKLLFTTVLAAGLAVSVHGQGTIIIGNKNNDSVSTAATANGQVWTNNLGNIGLFDGYNLNLGITVLYGATSSSLSPLCTYLESDVTGYDVGKFIGTYASPATWSLSGVSGGATAWIDLQLWASAGGGPYTTFAAAKASGVALWGEALFQNPTGNPGASPPTVPEMLTGMPAVLLVVPEPATFALAGLGLASLLIFRRRK